MNRVLSFIVVAILIASCSPSKKATVTITLQGAPDSTEIVVSRLAINQVVSMDTLYLSNKPYKYSADCSEGSPDFYYFLNNGKKLFSLVLQNGDNITVSADLKGSPVAISGSEESVRFQEIEDQFSKTYNKFSNLSSQFVEATDSEAKKECQREMGTIYIKYKQKAVKYLYQNAKSISVIPLIYQKFTPELPLFADKNDVYILQNIYDSLKVAYPHSPYVAALADEIDTRRSYNELNDKLSSATETSYPNISLYDVNSNMQNLSDLEGKVTVLFFWTISDESQKIFNAELKDIYAKYHTKGMEVYQVSIDGDKTAWARQVKDQDLKWISVCDPGNVNMTLNLYNVTKIPTMYIIDKSGNIHAKDVFDIKALDRTISELVK